MGMCREAFLVASLMLAMMGAHAADIEQGKAKSKRCMSCHGLKGISKSAAYPNIAGQKEAYMFSQMKAFKAGKRPLADKDSLVEGLTLEDCANLAAYFATLPVGSAGSEADAALLDKGKASYASCAGCHGAQGEGADMGPRLAGQHAAYLIKRMADYKNGAANDASMQSIASAMSDGEIAAVAEYLASLR